MTRSGGSNHGLWNLPEIAENGAGASRVRIAPSIDVPMTTRVRRLLDCPAIRRLGSLSQLGFVSLVYPGATHTRLEHSLGVYANALQLLRSLRGGDVLAIAERLTLDDDVAAEAFIVAALTHDAGHWPFAHAIEDMGAVNGSHQRHEDRVAALLCHGELASRLRDDWRCTAEDILSILRPNVLQDSVTQSNRQIAPELSRFYATCLSGPIDIDKLDYLQRDSLHAGVPYGRNFDPDRLFAFMRPHPTQPKLAIGEKGRTAAEMMVFGRYVMFSEVYWHHAVRSATAMLQRSLWELNETDPGAWMRWADQPDAAWIESYCQTIASLRRDDLSRLSEGLMGPKRDLFKRIAEYDVQSNPELHSLLSRRPFYWLAAASVPMAERISAAIGIPVPPSHVLIDAPPVKLEVDINLDIIRSSGEVCSLGDVSPVASVLANQQFDSHVKRVRVFVPDAIRVELRRLGLTHSDTLSTWLRKSAEETDSQWT